MAHRAAVYTVRVRRSRKRKDKYRLLGNVDEAGAYLGDLLLGYLTDDTFAGVSENREKIVLCSEATLAGEGLLAIMLQGQSGIVADLFDGDGDLKAHQLAEDMHQIRCGVLFNLPADQETGWLAVHINNGRSAKGLMQAALNLAFHEQFEEVENLALEINPYVDKSALDAAIAQNKLDKVKLVRYERPNDRAAAATSKWVRAGDEGKLELTISASAERLVPDLIRRYIHGDNAALSQIVEFQNITFEEVKVVVELPNGEQKTINIEKPEAGHSFSEELKHLRFDDDGEPTAESLFAALSSMLGRVSS
jgi:hypothetical protein